MPRRHAHAQATKKLSTPDHLVASRLDSELDILIHEFNDDQEQLTSNLLNAIWGTDSRAQESEPTLREGIERRLNYFVQRRAEEIAQASPRSKSKQNLEEDVTKYIEELMAQCTKEQRSALWTEEKRRKKKLAASRRAAAKEFDRTESGGSDDSNAEEGNEDLQDRSDSRFSFTAERGSADELELMWLKYKRRQKVRVVAAISQQAEALDKKKERWLADKKAFNKSLGSAEQPVAHAARVQHNQNLWEVEEMRAEVHNELRQSAALTKQTRQHILNFSNKQHNCHRELRDLEVRMQYAKDEEGRKQYQTNLEIIRKWYYRGIIEVWEAWAVWASKRAQIRHSAAKYMGQIVVGDLGHSLVSLADMHIARGVMPRMFTEWMQMSKNRRYRHTCLKSISASWDRVLLSDVLEEWIKLCHLPLSDPNTPRSVPSQLSSPRSPRERFAHKPAPSPR